MYSVIIITGFDLVTTPCKNITFGCSNCPIIEASVKKSFLDFSCEPAFNVLMATSISLLPFIFNFPLHTSPNSPPPKSYIFEFILESLVFKNNSYL